VIAAFIVQAETALKPDTIAGKSNLGFTRDRSWRTIIICVDKKKKANAKYCAAREAQDRSTCISPIFSLFLQGEELCRIT
jgi:hypothetical protein